MKTGLKVMDAMTKKPVYVNPEEMVIRCTKLMLEKRVGSLLIKNKDNLMGFLTERDLVKMISMGIDSKTTKVKQIMTTKIITISPEKDIYDAIVLMNKENVRRLPVIIKDRVIGMITLRDILSLQPTLFEIILERVETRHHKKMNSVNLA